MIRGTDRRRYHHHDNFHGIHQHYCHYVVDLNGSFLFRSHEMQNLFLLGSYIFHDYHAMKWRMNIILMSEKKNSSFDLPRNSNGLVGQS